MSFYKLNIKAGVPYLQEAPGVLLLIDKIEGANGIDVTLVVAGNRQQKMPDRKPAFKRGTRFDGAIYESAVDCTVYVWQTFDNVSLGFSDGAQVNVLGSVGITNDGGNPVPVTVSGGVTLNASNVSINNGNAAAVPVKSQGLFTIEDYNEVTIAGIAAVPLIADVDLRRLRVRNSHATAILVLGGAGVTLTNSPIRLLPGDVFIEEDAAGASWWAITDTPGATVQIQGVTL
jgi:hypothetical protein